MTPRGQYTELQCRKDSTEKRNDTSRCVPVTFLGQLSASVLPVTRGLIAALLVTTLLDRGQKDVFTVQVLLFCQR